MITPTNGRVVWYSPGAWDTIHQIDKAKPLAALVTHVWGDRMVNLCVFDSDGVPCPRTSVPLLQDDDARADRPVGPCCEWMPYQKGQAAKTDELEKEKLALLKEGKAVLVERADKPGSYDIELRQNSERLPHQDELRARGSLPRSRSL